MVSCIGNRCILTSVCTCSLNISKSLTLFGMPRFFSVSPSASAVEFSAGASAGVDESCAPSSADGSASMPSEESPFCPAGADSGSAAFFSFAIRICSMRCAIDSSSVFWRCSGLSDSASLCAYDDRRSMRPTTMALMLTCGFSRATAERNWSRVCRWNSSGKTCVTTGAR